MIYDRLEVEPLFVAAGCNRVVNNVSWGAAGMLAFGAHNALALFSPELAQIVTTLPGHKSAVNCTYWLPSCRDSFKVQCWNEHFLLSGGADGTIILWGITPNDKKWRYILQVPGSPKKGVSCITGTVISEKLAVFASTSLDGNVSIWELIFPASPQDECKVACIDTLFIGAKPMVALALSELLDDNKLILAMGGLDNKIHLYSGGVSGQFVKACELKGHTDWIRSLDFSLIISDENGKSSILLVSSSQDKCIRIWKVGSPDKRIGLLSYIKGPSFTAGGFSYQVSLESLLIGHEDWVYSVKWQPPIKNDKDGHGWYQPQSILSASMDKTMMIWKPEKTTGIWVNMVTVGELSHCALGFYGGHWGPAGDSILAYGYGGSFHMWKDVGIGKENWQPQIVPSGHSAVVTDIAWAKSGEYLLSVSHDQTTRIFAPWTSGAGDVDKVLWHEIARPQVHGHDINCVTIIQGKGNQRFVSGADEKVARVFEAPSSFLKTLKHALSEKLNCKDELSEGVQVLGAKMSALGLSQKPIYVQAGNEVPDRRNSESSDSLDSTPDSVPVVLTKPGIEDQLAWHTLWPESHKLYGHGNELFSLCCNSEGSLVASSCKAQSAAVAEIWLWEVGTWKAAGRIRCHTLTVTHLEFSADDSFLLAVSRDRHFSVFSIDKSGSGEIYHQLIARHEAHKRIIWACSWNPYKHEFATGSRDKTVKIWRLDGTSSVRQLTSLPPFSSGVTALSWAGVGSSKNGLLAIGMEDGLIEVWQISDSEVAATPAVRFDPFLCHVSTVQRLSWRKSDSMETAKSFQLASCGADHCVRVYSLTAS